MGLRAAEQSTFDAGVFAPTPEIMTRLKLTRPPTIIVPVFNAYDELVLCIAALLRNTTVAGVKLLLIDDASTDPRVAPFLDGLQSLENVVILRNEVNRGFVRTVNRGFSATTGDVVILNSDAEVTPRWLENLMVAAYINPLVGTVTPFSDNAGAFSAPKPGVANDIPGSIGRDDLARLVTRHSARLYPSGPTGNGFCMYVKRAFLETVGEFDAESFPRGYGEENDLCMRGLKAGWQHIVDDATYVFHRRSASFGQEKHALLEAGQAKLAELHPEYRGLVREFLSSERLEKAQNGVGVAFDEARSLAGRPVPIRVLYILHSGIGGTPETNMDLMEALNDSYECFLLTSDTRTLRLFSVHGRELDELESCVLEEPIRTTDFHNETCWDFVAGVLEKYAIELVHIRHLFKHTLDIATAARALSIPVILSFHDYYYICPTIQLLDNNDHYCGGRCTPGQGTCRIPKDLLGGPHLKHSWVYVWRERMREMFEDVDAFVTTTSGSKATYLTAFPELSDRPFSIIEHGRDLARISLRPQPPGREERIRIVVPGTMTVSKGVGFIRQLKSQDREGRLDFHFLGPPNQDASDLGTQHGAYEREEFPEKLLSVAPHFIGLFSIWAETYSHTLTEAWAMGVPVVASDLGALGERIRNQGGGWLVDVDSPEDAYEAILTAAADTDGYRRAVIEAEAASIRSVGEMRDDYDALYRSVLRSRRFSLNSSTPS
jgi:GT2 family glycosyltransferase